MSFSPVHPAHLAYVRSSYAALNDFSIPSHSAVAHTDNGTDTDTDTDTNTNTDTGISLVEVEAEVQIQVQVQIHVSFRR